MTLIDGRPASVVLAGPRHNPKAAALVLPEAGSQVRTAPLHEKLELLLPDALISILCMQERAFGASGLPPPGAVLDDS